MKYNYWRFKFPLLTVWVFIFLIATTRAQIQVNPTRHDFGDVNIESASPGQTFTLTNTGSDTLTLGKIQPLDEMGNPSTLFLVVNDPCSQQAVTAAGRCQITAVFQPQDLGPRTATLTITSNDPQMSQLGVPLMGNGIDVSMPQSDITVEPMSHDFGELNIGLRSEYLSLKIANTGNKRLQLKDIALEGSDFIHTDLCSDRGVGPNQVCWTQVQFEALSPPGIKSGWLQIPSDDSDTPLVEVSLTGTSTPWCSGNYKQGLRMRPETPDFGVEVVGQDSRSLRLRVRAWARGCGALEVTDVQLEGSHADEFTIEDLECQHGDRRRTHYSACQFRVIFNPASAGLKSANVALTFSDNQTRYLPLQAQAVEPPAAAGIEVTPMTAEFEPLEVGAVSEPQTFVVRNNGTVNLHFETISAQGPDARDFKVRGWRCVRRAGVLNPQGGQTCAIDVYFAPRSAGDKQASLTVVSNAPVVEIPLTGQGVEGSLCTDAQITIESVADGHWASATQTSNRLSYQGPSNAWNRLKNTSAVNRPVSTDIVRIKSGHTITAIPEQASIRALCIDSGGILESWDNQGSGINIYASEYLENKGTIQGQAGADATDCRAQDYRSAIGQPGCANPGARIDLSVNASEGQLYNEGIIMAGQGGQGEKYGAQGGDIYLSAPFLTNVQEGFIRAGDGGDLTGTQAGQAGNGGYIGMSARNSMSNQSSKGVYSGNGGNCNFNAAQQGGRGGNIGVFAPDLNLNEPYIAGKGGRNCGTNGRDGQVIIEPNNVIDLSGAQTQIEGGNLTIFGGQDWLLDLSNVNELALTASESLTLAVGEGGLIDLTGNDSPIFQAPEVYIFADDILVDEGVRLEDIIDADKIVVGPNQILYDVALIGPSIVRNQPGAVMPIQLKLANNGPEVDTYLLSMTDTADWPLSTLPATLKVKGLSVQALTANITLPATCGASNVVTVSAISQADPEVSAQVEIPVIASACVTEIEPQPPGLITQPVAETGLCPLNETIDMVCRNGGQTLENVTFKSRANVAGGTLAGDIHNNGIVSQVTVQANTVLSGGRLTGYIVNEGTLKDFEFLGAQIKGGTLAGDIVNNSQVGGTLTDVHLAADTQVRGGNVQGQIIGEAQDPALLTDMTVKSGSHLAHVLIGDGVRFGEQVTFDAVQFVDPKMDPRTQQPPEDDTTPPEDEEPAPACDTELPQLGALATDAEGKSLAIQTQLAGGIAVNEGEFKRKTTLNLADPVLVQGQLCVAAEHQGQNADIVVYAAYSAPEIERQFYMLNTQSEVMLWNEQPAELVAFLRNKRLKASQTIELYEGQFVAPGALAVHFGYRLADGTIVVTDEVIDLTIE